jgi:HAD superfamily hydrolase (TIGR01509 family)
MYDEKTRVFHQMPEAKVMPGVRELMSKIKSSGLTIGVVTGSGQRPLINRLLNDFSEFVGEQNITTAYDVKRGKPNPDPYLMGLQKAGNLNPWEAIVVENAPLGVKAGVAARIFTIAVNTGPLPDDVLKREGADLVLPDMPTLSKSWHLLF